MKKLIIILIIIMSVIYAQLDDNKKFVINLQNNFGYTIVEVAQAMETTEFSDITNEGLVDWDQFNYKGLVQVFMPIEKFMVGGEVGFNRLYRWEERYKTFDGYDRWRGGTIWTWHISALIQLKFADQYYLTTGTGIYTFMNGTGTTIGFPLAVGHVIKINDLISLPIEFRTDIIFGSGTPIALGGGIGIKFII
jgi:hypothetical protein